ncbi:MAG: queuosine precursor transporter [Oscillospiraceae bacterium]|nr:queuosine precursor transporter [Oscillospiraceae bacterium]
MNETLLALSVVVMFSMPVAWMRLFGKSGLFCWTAIATILANIEVLVLVRAFGMEQTLGNVLFASTFLTTDIISEVYGREAANRAVNIGVASSAAFIIVSQSWLMYTPSAGDWAFPSVRAIFSNTPRLVLASLVVYAASQKLDVALYHMWWRLTARKTGDKERFLWLRNNGSTLISQLINAALFNLGAFWGVYDARTLASICVSTYVIYVFTSLLDTPFVYLARRVGARAGE